MPKGVYRRKGRRKKERQSKLETVYGARVVIRVEEEEPLTSWYSLEIDGVKADVWLTFDELLSLRNAISKGLAELSLSAQARKENV